MNANANAAANTSSSSGAVVAFPGFPPGAGEVFGSYHLIEEIGRGASGSVFSAIQSGSGRTVAIKFIHASPGDAAEGLRRFRTEAEAVAALDHPGIAVIYDVGEHQGIAYHAMRFAEAGSLAERLGWYSKPRDAAALTARVAEAVQHAHERGILHRDLKPGNILLASRGEPLVSDFGLARWIQRESDVTVPQAILGTPDYLAPEMLRGAREGSTIAADIFSLGAILYHLLAGRPPFAGGSVGEVLRKLEECAPAPLVGVPRDLAAVCFKCLEREASRRYASAAGLAADLRAWLDGRAVQARPLGLAGRLFRGVRRKPALAALAVALVAAVVALGINIVLSRHEALVLERQRAEFAEQVAAEQRRAALFAQAQLRLRSHDAGRRTESLRLLREAWGLSPSAEIRSAAITALALPDLEETEPPPGIDLDFAEPDPVPEPDVALPARELGRAFHAGSRRLAVAGEDKVVYVLDERGRIVRRLRGHEGVCLAMAFSPDGHLLATCSDDHMLRLWDPASGRELVVLGPAEGLDSRSLRWSRDGGWIEMGRNRTLRVLPPRVAEFFPAEVEGARAEEVRTIDLSADGRWLVTGDELGTRLWDRASRREVATFPKTGTEWSAARFSPDGRTLWIGGWNSALCAVALPARGTSPLPEPGFVAEFAGVLVARYPDGSRLAALSNDGGGFQIRDAVEPHAETWLRHHHPLHLALAQDGTLAATSSYDTPGVRLWSAPTGEMIREIPAGSACRLAFGTNGSVLATAYGPGVTLWNLRTAGIRATIPAIARVKDVAFSPDGRLLAIETSNGIELHRGEPPYEELARLVAEPDRGAASFCFSVDSLELAVQTENGGAIVWQLGALRQELAALGMAWEAPPP